MKTKFHILFSIEVLHNFFSAGRWNEINFVPSPETEKLLKDYELTIRQIGNELLIITKIDSNGKAFHNIDLYTRFSFFLIPQTPGFLNFTNIPISSVSPSVFNFHNLNANEVGSIHFITAKIQDYKGGKSYLPGNLVKASDGKIYESIAKNTGGGSSVVPNNNVASKEAWVQHSDKQFVNIADSKEVFSGVEYNLELTGGIYLFKTSVKKKEHTVSVYAFSKDNLQYNKEVFSATASFDSIHDMVQIDMRQLPSGKYRIRVNDNIAFVYLVNKSTFNTFPFFVDVFNLPASNPQSFLDGAQKPKRTKYIIAFAALRVLWRYHTRTNTIDKIEDTEGQVSFKTDGLKKFISKKPIPFSEAPKKTLVAKSGSLIITSHLPNPQSDRLLEKKNEIYTTETFINF